MQALLRATDLCAFTKAGLERFQQAMAPLGVTLARPPQGTGKVPHFDELGQSRLQRHLSRAVQVVMCLLERLHQPLGYHQVTQLQTRVENFGE